LNRAAVRAFLKDCVVRGLSTAEAATLVGPEAIRRHLYLADMPDPDLIIRTSGEVRLSGTLLFRFSNHDDILGPSLWPNGWGRNDTKFSHFLDKKISSNIPCSASAQAATMPKIQLAIFSSQSPSSMVTPCRARHWNYDR
jgi:hypothetical protein